MYLSTMYIYGNKHLLSLSLSLSLDYFQLYSLEPISVKFESELCKKNAFKIVVCQNGAHVFQGEMS